MVQFICLSIPYKCHYVEGPSKQDRGSQSKKSRNTEHFVRVNFLRILHFQGVNWHFNHVNRHSNRVNWHSKCINRHSQCVDWLFMDVSLHSKQQIDANEMPIDPYKMQNSEKLTPTKRKRLRKLTCRKFSILQGF